MSSARAGSGMTSMAEGGPSSVTSAPVVAAGPYPTAGLGLLWLPGVCFLSRVIGHFFSLSA